MREPGEGSPDDGERSGAADGETSRGGGGASPGTGESGRRGESTDPGSGGEIGAELERLRQRIVNLDDELIRLIGARRDLVLEIGRLKRELDLPVLDPSREAEVVRRAAERSRDLGVDEELTRDVIWRIIASAREAQEGERGWGPPEDPRPGGERTEDG